MSNFQILSPVKIEKDEFQNSIYREAFDFVFDHDEIRNVAISGAYGAGKSSIFNTYMDYWKSGEKILRISLARFEQVDKCENGVTAGDESSLEAKIINQLVHQIEPSKIRRTGFLARKTNDDFARGLRVFFSSLGAFIAVILVFFEKLSPMFVDASGKWLMGGISFFFTGKGMVTLGCSLFALVFGLALWATLRSPRGSLLRKISVKDFSMDLSDDKEEAGSYFDKYLSEIRYLFDNSGSQIVAIEDIDRYVSSLIFEKIRELNTVVNLNRSKPVRFFYIIKDDLFISKDRTKFFDFIIPVVPIVDSSNSYGKMRSLLQLEGGNSGINNSFLRGLSFFIDDMRVLKNIVNEFLVYQRALEKQGLDPNKLLALITYKNLFPKDFNDFQMGGGYLYALTQYRKFFADQVAKKNNDEVKTLQQKAVDMENEHLANIDELNALYLKPSPIFSIGARSTDSYDSNLNFYKEMAQNPSQVSGIIQGGGRGPIDVKKKIEDLQNNPEYLKRKQAIDLKSKYSIRDLYNRISALQSKIHSVEDSWLFSNLLENTDIQEFLDLPCKGNKDKFKDITEDLHYPIIPFLLRQGMVDGYIQDYLTYFYDSELQIADQQFIRSFYDQKPLPLSHDLTNPVFVLERLGGVKENNPAFFISTLFFFVFDNEITPETRNYVKLCANFKRGDLIFEYLERGKNADKLIKAMNEHWATFFVDTHLNAEEYSDKQTVFLQMELLHEEVSRLGEIISKNELFPTIQGNKNLLTGVSEEDGLLIAGKLKQLFVELIDLGSLTTNNKVIDYIYDNNLYQPNVANAMFWIKRRYSSTIPIDECNLFSVVFSKPSEQLCVFATNRIGDLLSNIIEIFPSIFFTDNQQTINAILGSASTSLETKAEYAQRLVVPVANIEEIKDIEVINLLLARNLVTYSTNNLLVLFESFEQTFTDEFKEYLSKHINEYIADKSVNAKRFPKEACLGFINGVLDDVSLDEKTTEALLSVTGKKVEEQTKVLDEGKARALISSGALLMNTQNLDYLRNKHPAQVAKFQKANIADFLNLLRASEETTLEEVEALLLSDLNGRDQIALLANAKVRVPYQAQYKFPGVKAYIIKTFAETSDIEAIIKDAAVLANPLLGEAAYFLAENIDGLVQSGSPLTKPLFDALKKQKAVSQASVIEVFSNSLDLYDSKNIEAYIRELGIEPFVEMYDGKHPDFQTSPVNQKILSSLQKKDIVTLAKTNKLYLKAKNDSADKEEAL